MVAAGAVVVPVSVEFASCAATRATNPKVARSPKKRILFEGFYDLKLLGAA